MIPAHLRRKPFLLLAAGELTVMVALGAIAWNVWQSHQPPSAQDGAAALPNPAPPQRAAGPGAQPRGVPSPSPANGVPGGSHPGPTPGFRTDSIFFNQQVWAVNRGEAELEQTEWRITHAAMDGVRAYIQRVVLPAVNRAEHAGGSR